MSKNRYFAEDFNEFFQKLQPELDYRLNSIRRAGFPINEMRKLLNDTYEAVTLKTNEKKKLDSYFSSSNQPVYASLIHKELIFFNNYIDKFNKKRNESKYSIKKQVKDYEAGAKILWKPFLESLKTFIDSLKEFLENHPSLKGILSIYGELLAILA